MPRQRLWVDTRIASSMGAGVQQTTELMTGIGSTTTRVTQMTLIRTIVGIDIAAFTHDAGEGSGLVSCGIGVASQEAFAANALPDPNTETDFPTRGWVWRAEYRIYSFAADQPAVYNRRIDLDLRSMRKLENGEPFFICHHLALEGVAVTLHVSGLIRQLWLIG